MKKVKDHKKTESILPFLHNQRDSEKITQHRTTNSDKNHKDTQKTKRIQVIQQIKKSTIEKFKNLTKKSNFLRKNKIKLHHPSKHKATTTNQRISYNFRPRKQCNINNCESSEESANSSFFPSSTSTQSKYPSISHNHTYNREISSVKSSSEKAQSTIDTTPSKENVTTSNTPQRYFPLHMSTENNDDKDEEKPPPAASRGRLPLGLLAAAQETTWVGDPLV